MPLSADAQTAKAARELHPELSSKKKLLAFIKAEHGVLSKEGKAAYAELEAEDAAAAAAAWQRRTLRR